jgi:ATP-dependent RNA helicase SUPV3L1/SUV3
MKRTIIAHLGPTNSGKTYRALADLKESSSGTYCAPLRLLAIEVGEQLSQSAIKTRIVTGQEISGDDSASHTSCTIEMVNLDRHVNTAVIDEIQLLADETRGWAFTRALLGLPAETLHVCGSPEILPLLSKLVKQCGDELIMHVHQRLSKLVVQSKALNTFSELQDGDCVIAFSRRAVHSIKRDVMRQKEGIKVSIIYGSLPPASRKHQAAVFNNNLDGQILIATDAIGMGLNLRIKRIIFSSLSKWDGSRVRPLRASEVRQIAGRAGRFDKSAIDKGEAAAAGYVTTLHDQDIELLHDKLQERPIPPIRGCLLPRSEDIISFAANVMNLPNSGAPFSTVLKAYKEHARISELFFLGQMDQAITLADLLDEARLPLQDLITFCLSPTDPNNTEVAAALLRFAEAFVETGNVSGDLCGSSTLTPPSTEAQLKDLEAMHQVFDLYIWLSYRFHTQFYDRDYVEGLRYECSCLIQQGLENLERISKRPRKRSQVWPMQFHSDRVDTE